MTLGTPGAGWGRAVSPGAVSPGAVALGDSGGLLLLAGAGLCHLGLCHLGLWHSVTLGTPGAGWGRVTPLALLHLWNKHWNFTLLITSLTDSTVPD